VDQAKYVVREISTGYTAKYRVNREHKAGEYGVTRVWAPSYVVAYQKDTCL